MSQLLKKIQEFNELEEKKNAETRQKMINYGKELKTSIDLKTDLRQKQKKVEMNYEKRDHIFGA